MAIRIVPRSAVSLARELERRAAFLADLLELAARPGFDDLAKVATPEMTQLSAEAIFDLAEELRRAVRVAS